MYLTKLFPQLPNEVRPFNASAVHVVLHDGTKVLVDKADLTDLLERGITYRWTATSNGRGRSYVVVNHPGGKGISTVASLITQRERWQHVRYANGNSFDLRNRNLRVVGRGRGRRRSADAHFAAQYPKAAEQGWVSMEFNAPEVLHAL